MNECGYILVGGTKSSGAVGSDTWLIETDSEGDKVWERTLEGASGDYFDSAQATSDGGYHRLDRKDHLKLQKQAEELQEREKQ